MGLRCKVNDLAVTISAVEPGELGVEVEVLEYVAPGGQVDLPGNYVTDPATDHSWLVRNKAGQFGVWRDKMLLPIRPGSRPIEATTGETA